MPFKHFKDTVVRKSVSLIITSIFILASVGPLSYSYAQSQPKTVLNLPVPGTMVQTTSGYNPAIIRGLTINPENPLQFDFIIDTGDDDLQGDQLQAESTKLIKYFLTSLTVSEENMWVNLSPFEKDRIIPEGFGRTEMGRDLLAQDYLLKQLTASMMYPEDELGKAFWERVYARAQKEFGTIDIPVNTFNKIWIVPATANVYVNDQNVFVVESHLKVMLEEDYLALDHHSAEKPGDEDVVTGVASDTLREILIPEIEQEVNNGRTFANLRQIYHSMILAAWYKKNLKQSFLNQVYINKEKTVGVENADDQINQKIYDQYVTAFKEGVYSYIKEEYNPELDEVLPKKYFSGGVDNSKLSRELGQVSRDNLVNQRNSAGRTVRVIAGLQSNQLSFQQSESPSDQARLSFKQSYRLGDQQTLLAATITDLMTPEGAVRDDLGSIISSENIQAFKQVINAANSRENSGEVLIALTPLVAQLSTFSLITEIDSKTRHRFEEILSEIKTLPSTEQQRQQVVSEILGEFNGLSDEVVGQILQQALRNLASHLQLSRNQFTDLDNVRIDLQLNADDAFNIRSARADEAVNAVLEVDAIKMLLGYADENVNFSWKMNQYGLLVNGHVQSLIDSGEATEFVQNNMQLVQEMASLLLYVQNSLDALSGQIFSGLEDSQTIRENAQRLLDQRIEELNADRGNAEYIALFQLLQKIQVSADAANVGDSQARVRAVVDFVLSRPALRRRVGVVGTMQDADISQIQKIIQDSDRPLYNLVMNESTQADVADNTPSQQEVLSQTTREAVVILTDGTAKEYAEAINTSSQYIQGIENNRERLTAFLTDVWPQYLNADDNGVANESVQNATLNAVAVLGDSELHNIYSRLIKASGNVGRNRNKIQDIAGELRRNRFLRNAGLYVQVEVKSLPRRNARAGIERVDVLTSESYVIDRVDIDPEVSDNQGNPVEIIYLGERLDSDSTGTTMRGFNWAGDTFGVVVKANIVNNARNNIIWYLFDENTNDVELDRLEQSIQEAYRKDYPTNPTEEEVEAILNSRYEATAIHERQHIRDGVNNVQRHFSGRGMRIAQETTAYLSSIAFSGSPFTELVKVLNLYMYSQQGRGALADFHHGNVHSKATDKVLHLFAERLNVQGLDLDVKNMRESNTRLLEAALSLSPTQLQTLAESILNEVIEAQLAGRSYGSEVVFNRLINQVGDRGRAIGIFIAKAAVKLFGGSYTVQRGSTSSTAMERVDFTKEVNVVSQVGLPVAIREASLFQEVTATDPVNISLADLIIQSRQERETGDVYATRASENISSVQDANDVTISKDVSLSEVAKMYFDDYYMHTEIHSPNQDAYQLEPALESDDLNSSRSFYFVPAGTNLNIPYGLNVTYEVQPEDNLMSIARKFYELNARGERKALIEFDGVKDRWLWERITLANGLSSTAVTAGQKLIVPTNVVEYGVNVLNRSDSSATRPLVGSQVDNSKLSSTDATFTKGGIDLNSNNLELETTGNSIIMTVPNNVQHLQNVTIDGFVPVIINIVPINNLPLIMGGVDLQDSIDNPTDSAQKDLPIAVPSHSDLLTRLDQ